MKAKQTRKISKKKAGNCPQCRARLKAGDRECPACLRQAPLFEGKGVRLVLITKGGAVRRPVAWGCPCRRLNKASAVKCAGCKSARGSGWDCLCGRPNYGKAGFCAGCGSRKGTTATQQLAKAAPGAGTFLAKQAAGMTDPDARVRAYAALDAEAMARGTALPFVAKALGYRDMADAATNSHDPAERAFFYRALTDPNGAA